MVIFEKFWKKWNYAVKKSRRGSTLWWFLIRRPRWRFRKKKCQPLHKSKYGWTEKWKKIIYDDNMIIRVCTKKWTFRVDTFESFCVNISRKTENFLCSQSKTHFFGIVTESVTPTFFGKLSPRFSKMDILKMSNFLDLPHFFSRFL